MNSVSYYANGELKVVYLSTDKSILDKVEKAFLHINQRYDFECDISDYTTTVEAWGNEPYIRYFKKNGELGI